VMFGDGNVDEDVAVQRSFVTRASFKLNPPGFPLSHGPHSHIQTSAQWQVRRSWTTFPIPGEGLQVTDLLGAPSRHSQSRPEPHRVYRAPMFLKGELTRTPTLSPRRTKASIPKLLNRLRVLTYGSLPFTQRGPLCLRAEC